MTTPLDASAPAVLLPWLQTYVWHLCALLIGAGVLLHVARVRSAVLRSVIWKAALSTAVFTATVAVTHPGSDPTNASLSDARSNKHPTPVDSDAANDDEEPLTPAGCASIGYAPRPRTHDRLKVVRRAPETRQVRVATFDWMRRSCPSAISGERQPESVLTASSLLPANPCQDTGPDETVRPAGSASQPPFAKHERFLI